MAPSHKVAVFSHIGDRAKTIDAIALEKLPLHFVFLS
jgi:hypothetical protein